jgi:hypothetical protein
LKEVKGMYSPFSTLVSPRREAHHVVLAAEHRRVTHGHRPFKRVRNQ